MSAWMDRPSQIAAKPDGDLAGLLGAIAGGDRAALSALYQLTASRLYGVCLHMLRNEAEAEDALQDV